MKGNVTASALCACSAVELCGLLAEGRATSVQVVQAYLQRIAARNQEINAYIAVEETEALREADASDTRRAAGALLSPLDGVPIAVKDNLMRKSRRCTCASRMLEGFEAPYDATVIEKIKGAGMPVLGSLNMDEFAMGSRTETSVFGPCQNPWDTARVAGGSSGGSAAAVAAGMAPVALGSDTGGSVRQPAAFCGVVGVKPAYGTVSRYGLVAFASSLDHVGVLAKTAQDAAMVMNIIAGSDPRDMTSDDTLKADFAERCARPLKIQGLTLGKPIEYLDAGLDAGVRSCLAAAEAQWERLGAKVVEVSIPSLRFALSAYYVLSSAEAGSNLARYDGVRYGHPVEEQAGVEQRYKQSRGEGFGEEVKRRILLGTFALSSGYQEQYYAKAQEIRRLLQAETAMALEACDALLMPVTPTAAFRLEEKAVNPVTRYADDLYTVPANLTGLPALSVPCGLSGGLPVGMGLMGRRDGLPLLLGMVHTYETAYPEAHGKPPWNTAPKEEGGVKE